MYSYSNGQRGALLYHNEVGFNFLCVSIADILLTDLIFALLLRKKIIIQKYHV